MHICGEGLVETVLAKLNIPASVIGIEECLYVARKLRNLTIDPGDRHFGTVDGILYDKGLKTLLRCPPLKTGEVVVPQTAEVVAGHAFEGCDAFDRVILPEDLARISSAAFSGCRFWEWLDTAAAGGAEHHLLYSILPEGIAVIGYHEKGFDVRIPGKLPATVTIMPGWSFAGCNRPTLIAIPRSVQNVDARAFERCDAIRQTITGDSRDNP
jgi:hypothetical protein